MPKFQRGTHVQVNGDGGTWYGQIVTQRGKVYQVRFGGAESIHEVQEDNLELHPMIAQFSDERIRRIVETGARNAWGLPKSQVVHLLQTCPDNDFFFLSNEFDWKGIELLQNRRQVTISFGNNIGWDTAMEYGCTDLVLCDWHPVTMEAHEKLLRPLILASTGPAQFLSRLVGRPLKVGNAAKLLTKGAWTQEELLPVFSSLRTAQYSRQELEEFQTQTLVELSSWKPNYEIKFELGAFLRAHYRAINARILGGKADFPMQFNGLRRAQVKDSERDMSIEMLEHFEGRYAKEGRMSCMAEPPKWAYLQHLFAGTVFYSVGDLMDPAMWAAIGRRFGTKKYVINFSNVLDYLIGQRGFGALCEKANFQKALVQLRRGSREGMRFGLIQDICAAMGDVFTEDEEVSILFTTGLQSPHSYERVVFKPNPKKP